MSLLAAAVLLVVQAIPPASAESIDLSKIAATPNPRLGLAFPGSRTEYYPLIARAGIGVVRISAAWDRLEPEPGERDWSGLDARVAALQAHGIEPFLTFESNAAWATLPETHGVKNARPRDPATWEDFVRATVDRYDADGRNDMPGLSGPVRYWQAANEWISDSNRSGGWIGSAEDLIDYIRRTHDAVKAEDPAAIFVLGGLSSASIDVLQVARGEQEFVVRQKWEAGSETVWSVDDMRGPEFAEIIDGRVLPVLNHTVYDMADVHLYGPEDRDAARIRFIRKLTGRPVLSSECGGPSLDYGGGYTPQGHFDAVMRRNLGVLAAGAGFCLWFRLGEGPGSTFGNQYTALYTSDAVEKPGVYAYRLLARVIGPQTVVTAAGADLFALRRGSGDTVWIGWNDGAARARSLAAETGGAAFCLEDAVSGRLSSNRDDCSPDSMVLAGRDLGSLLAP